MSLLRDPLVHFFVLGGLLFGLWTVAQRMQHAPDRGPREAPVAISRTITVGTEDVAALTATFSAAQRREPHPAELVDLVQAFVNEEILFREGMAQGLDRDDRVVRRRVIEKMTALARPAARATEPSREELLRWYQTYRHRFLRPATATLDQLFFDRARHDDAAGVASRALAQLRSLPAADPPPLAISDRSVLPVRLVGKSALELAHILSPELAAEALAAPAGQWRGPVTSRHGLHLIRVVDRQPEALPPFEQVERQVRADWLTVETRGLRAAAESFLPRYEIVIPPALRRQVAAAPQAPTPFWLRVR